MAIFAHCILHRLLVNSFLILSWLLNSQLAGFSHPLQQQREQPPPPLLFQSNACGDKCGSLQIPFPFYYINTSSFSSCESISDAFRLSCQNSTSLFLDIGSQSYRVLQFFPDGVLVDFPNTSSSSCRPYIDLNAFGFEGNDYFGISADNVLGLYDCEDSSLCKADCEKSLIIEKSTAGCDGGYQPAACCYPLSDHTSWQIGDGFSVFKQQFGCRGFSCWVVPSGKRGVKLEWAVPNNSSKAACAPNAYSINATSVASGIRCQCPNGFVGDAFAQGVGCLKSCLKDGKEAYGKDCVMKGHNWTIADILAGVLTSAVSIASLTTLFCLLKRPIKSNTYEPDQGNNQGTISLQKACKTRYFAYYELEEATKGFDAGQKLADGTKGTLYAGVLGDGCHVAVHKVHRDCESERDFTQVIAGVEVLSAVPHENLARLVGCCIDTGYTPLVVYEYPGNGTLEEHLHQSRQQIGLDWYNRLNIASEIADILAFLQYEISGPIFHHGLQSSCIFLDEEFSVKVAGFVLLSANPGDGSPSHGNSERSNFCRSDVYSLGVVLLEIITGTRPSDLPTIALQKIRSGKLEEILDPLLNYHEQPPFRREQIEIVADIATRCLLFGGDGKLGMMDVARELMHVKKECMDGSSRRGPALEETFSNSSLLQMISMSPDSIYVP